MTCNVIWLRQALAEYQDRLNNVLCVTAAEIPALEYRRANGEYIPRAQFMASIRYELNVRCDMLKEYEKKYGRVDLGPKWGLNEITGKPRKKNEAIA